MSKIVCINNQIFNRNIVAYKFCDFNISFLINTQNSRFFCFLMNDICCDFIKTYLLTIVKITFVFNIRNVNAKQS